MYILTTLEFPTHYFNFFLLREEIAELKEKLNKDIEDVSKSNTKTKPIPNKKSVMLSSHLTKKS